MSKKKLGLPKSTQLAVVALNYFTDEALRSPFVSKILEESKVPNNCSTLSKVAEALKTI